MGESNVIELAKLDKLISELQWQIFNAGGIDAASTSMLVKRLAQAQSRSSSVQQEDQHEKEQKERTEQQERSWVIARAERELALSQSEQREYASFLECEFFTKSMFPRLDHFYRDTWDRLSEEGKSEMSHRVWEGVKRGEYEFSELPESVKEREAQRVNELLRSAGSRRHFDSQIPAPDANDFLASYNSENIQESYRVLNRQVFARAMSNKEPDVITSHDVIAGKSELKESVRGNTPYAQQKTEEGSSPAIVDLPLDADLLKSLQAAQKAPSQPAADFKTTGDERKR